MNDIPPKPTDPAQIKAWVESLTSDQTMALAESIIDRSRSVTLPQAPVNPRIDVPAPPTHSDLLTIHVSIQDSDPSVWRRLQVRGDLTLADLHPYLQAAMGWFDLHLHRFRPGSDEDGPYFISAFDEDEGDEGTPEVDVRLDQVLRRPDDVLTYEYDLGDGWTHAIRLEEVAPLVGEAPARCLGGAGECPLEDSGGIHSYNETAAWIRSGFADEAIPDAYDEESVEELQEWLPPGFDPDFFDLDQINGSIDLVARGDASLITAGLGFPDELVGIIGDLDPVGQFLAMAWMGTPGWEEPILLGVDAAREMVRPWVTVLDKVGDGVQLTSAGYLPPAVVQAIFEDLDLGSEWFGKGNREEHTRPIAELRNQAQRWGLLRKAKDTLRPTARCAVLRSDPVALWWHIVRQLPMGEDEIDQHAGWLTLVGAGSGVWGRELEVGVARLLGSLGWRHADGQPPRAMRATSNVIQSMVGSRHRRRDDTPADPRAALIARAAVLGRPGA